MRVNKEYMQGYEMSFWKQVVLSVAGLVSYLVFMSVFAN